MDNNQIILENEETNVTAEPVAEIPFDEDAVKKEKKKYYASFLWKLTLVILIILIIQAIFMVPQYVFVGFMDEFSKRIHNNFTYAYKNFVDSGYLNTISEILKYIYLMVSVAIGSLILYFMTKKTAKKPEQHKLNFGWWLILFLCCFGISGIGTIIGSITDTVIQLPAIITKSVLATVLSGSTVINSLLYADDSWAYLIFGIITVGIVIPILEEFIFRKIVIDSTSKYGYGAAIMISAFTFAVYHGNFLQFFYAFGLGLLFAYIYSNTGKLRYTVFLHMCYNLYASLVIPLARKTIPAGVTESINNALNKLSAYLQTHPNNFSQGIAMYQAEIERILSQNPFAIFGIMLTAFVNLFYYFLILVGIILIIVFIKKAISVRKDMMLGQKGTKRCAAGNWGAILFYVFAVGMFLLYYGMIYLATIMTAFV
ncbi:MAG: CPBP family intramembrane metalloprotease [Lachnospiraceae bacterium]|nr:CPBP family intramembrane metalloprotease [Lachnospiraceae bacterium]